MHTTTSGRVVVALLLVVLPQSMHILIIELVLHCTLASMHYTLARIILLQYSRVVILFPITCVTV